MSKLKGFVFYTTVLFLSLFLISIGYSLDCSYSPTKVEIYSGGNYVGNVLNETVYIKGDLNRYPLKIIYTFENTNSECFSSKDDVTMKLTSNSISVSANSYNQKNDGTKYIDTFEFDFNPSIIVNSYLDSSYNVKSIYSNNYNLYADDESPVFSQVIISPSEPIYSPNENISVEIHVSDYKSGLKSLSISTSNIPYNLVFNKNKSIIYTYNFQPSKDTNLNLIATDFLGNVAVFNKTFVVDSDPPVLDNESVDESFISSDNKFFLNFHFVLEDESFKYYDETPNVYGDFSEINSGYSSVKATCLRSSDETFFCSFENIPIDFDTSKSVNIKINATDFLGNSKTYDVYKTINVDRNPPVIEDFYLTNKLGARNIFSAYDNSSYIYLKFKDDSLTSYENLPTIFADFGPFSLIVPNCQYDFTDHTGTCIWNLSTSVSKYAAEPSGNLTLKLAISDIYSNYNYKDIVVKYDNVPPNISEVDILEKESFKDGIYKSGEPIDIVVYINDSDIDVDGNYKVFMDASSITNRLDYKELKPTSCGQYYGNEIQCEFRNIYLTNGYLNTSFYIYAYDAAGNLAVKKKDIQIFAVSDEEANDFVSDLTYNALNPIDRNLLKESSVTVWFEGKFKLNDEGLKKGIKIVNYQLRNCNESQLNPLLLNYDGYQLYPNSIVYVNGSNMSPFIVKVDLINYSNFVDMNEKTMSCYFSVLKRDDTKVYPPELVKVNLKFGFYNLPRGTLLTASAENLMSQIEDVKWTQGWFQKTYDIYKIFRDACMTIGSGASILNTISEMISIVQSHLQAEAIIGCTGTGSAQSAVTETKTGLMGILTGKNEYIKKMCDYVTCRNGAWLGDMMSGAYSDTWVGDFARNLKEFQTNMANAVCGVTNPITDNKKEGSN